MIEVTSVTSFPVANAAKLKAKGVVTLNNAVELKYLVIEGPKGPFVTWEGTTTYDKKDGSGKGYNSPIFIKDKETNETVTKAVLEKYKNRNGGSTRAATPEAPAVDSAFGSDDIPF